MITDWLGPAMFAGALALLSLGFLLATAAAALAIFLDAWLALLLVGVVLLVLTAVAAALRA